MQENLISIIVPVYNVSKYLRHCVDSLLRQTYENIEILLVDDGSTDDSGELCDQFMESDNRIRVIHQKNQGVSVARNEGLRQARGSWVMFVDSDDWVEPEICETLLDRALKSNCDICGCDLLKEVEGERPQIQAVYKHDVLIQKPEMESLVATLLHKNIEGTHYNRSVMNGHSCIQALLGPYCKLYRKDIVDGIEFPQHIQYAEDTLFVLRVMIGASSVAWVNQALYHYRFWPMSLVNKYDKRRAEDCVSLDRATLEYIKGAYGEKEELLNAFAYGCFLRATRLFHYYARKTKKREFASICKLLKATLKSSVYFKALRNPALKFDGLKRRFQLFLLRNGFVGVMYIFVRFL